MNINSLVIAAIAAIQALFDIIEHSGIQLSEEDIAKIRLGIIGEIDRIAKIQTKDEHIEHKIVRG